MEGILEGRDVGDAKYKRKHKELGLCIFCSEPVAPDRVYCLKHLESHNKNQKKRYHKDKAFHIKLRIDRYRRNVDKGNCGKCGVPIRDGNVRLDGKPYSLCVNCRSVDNRESRRWGVYNEANKESRTKGLQPVSYRRRPRRDNSQG